jgi:hypothetical protein
MVKFNHEGRYGIEIEFPASGSHGHITEAAIVSAAEGLGVQITNDGYHHTTRRYWRLTQDVSVTGHGWEIVSPILQGLDGMEQLRKVCKALHMVGAKVDSSCGLHVHHDANSLTAPQLRHLAYLYSAYQPAISEALAPSRRDGRWSYGMGFDSVDTAINRDIHRGGSIGDIVNAVRTNRCACQGRPGCSRQHRFQALNFEAYRVHGTVEFRQHQGSTQFERIWSWVVFTQTFVTTASLRVKTAKPSRNAKGEWRGMRNALGLRRRSDSDAITFAAMTAMNKQRQKFLRAEGRSPSTRPPRPPRPSVRSDGDVIVDMLHAQAPRPPRPSVRSDGDVIVDMLHAQAARDEAAEDNDESAAEGTRESEIPIGATLEIEVGSRSGPNMRTYTYTANGWTSVDANNPGGWVNDEYQRRATRQYWREHPSLNADGLLSETVSRRAAREEPVPHGAQLTYDGATYTYFVESGGSATTGTGWYTNYGTLAGGRHGRVQRLLSSTYTANAAASNPQPVPHGAQLTYDGATYTYDGENDITGTGWYTAYGHLANRADAAGQSQYLLTNVYWTRRLTFTSTEAEAEAEAGAEGGAGAEWPPTIPVGFELAVGTNRVRRTATRWVSATSGRAIPAATSYTATELFIQEATQPPRHGAQVEENGLTYTYDDARGPAATAAGWYYWDYSSGSGTRLQEPYLLGVSPLTRLYNLRLAMASHASRREYGAQMARDARVLGIDNPLDTV